MNHFFLLVEPLQTKFINPSRLSHRHSLSATMFEGKLNLPEKACRAFPDRLGSLAAGFDIKDDRSGKSDSAFESGEELEILKPNGPGSAPESEDDYVEMMEEHFESRVRRNPKKYGSRLVSVKEVIAADDKRSDLEYEKEINLEKLQRIADTGLPDGGGLRATAWKQLLLGYLPSCRDLWEKELTENRQKYLKLKEELLLRPSLSCTNQIFISRQSEITRIKDEVSNYNDQNADNDVDGPLRRQEISQEDHPLSSGKASVWHQYFQEAMRNILLLFAKLNPVIRYVQGMNEVLAPMYYVFSTDPDEQNAENAEADSFSCFVRLLSDSVDHFCQQLDNSSGGILSTLSHLAELLKANDEELWRHLEYTNEHMLLRVCCAMLLCMKNRLLSGDFVANLQLLQHYPDVNIEHLLQVARDLSPDTSSCSLSP
ncbi:Rab-GAP TBC domain-containing protein [Citrus sinensis]|uniref:Rab-GAP TBC domain-containing protein n=1 Tax=Citrus sinensis TaxID=2711 RepID=A0ACB8NPZ5_CITSI|nr:Rab-GAP TBC domain-containing protein [Citrus sinensis]